PVSLRVVFEDAIFESAQAGVPGPDPDGARGVFVNRINVVVHQAVLLRIGRDDLLARAIQPFLRSPDPEVAFAVFVERGDVGKRVIDIAALEQPRRGTKDGARGPRLEAHDVKISIPIRASDLQLCAGNEPHQVTGQTIARAIDTGQFAVFDSGQ